MADPRETGKDTEVRVNGQTVAYTNATYDLVYDTADSDLNDSPTPYTAVVSRYMEGTLEWDGTQLDAHTVFLNAEGDQAEDIQIEIEDTEKTIVGDEVLLTNLSREHPADDKTSGTIDFKADTFRRA